MLVKGAELRDSAPFCFKNEILLGGPISESLRYRTID